MMQHYQKNIKSQDRLYSCKVWSLGILGSLGSLESFAKYVNAKYVNAKYVNTKYVNTKYVNTNNVRNVLMFSL